MIDLSTMTPDLWEETFDTLFDILENPDIDEATAEQAEADLELLGEWDWGLADDEFIGFLGADGAIYADEADALAADMSTNPQNVNTSLGTYNYAIPEWMLS